MRKYFFWKTLFFFFIFFQSSSLFAADPFTNNTQALPPSIEPGHIAQNQIVAEPTYLFKPDDETLFPEIQTDHKKIKPDQEEFIFKSVQLYNISVYSKEDILKIFKDKIGSSINIQDLFDMAEKITEMYHKDGYILSRVVVPPQDIVNGIVHFQGVEGYISEIRIKNNNVDEGSQEYQRVQSMASHILKSLPLNVKDLERYLVLMNDLPGITVKAVVSPSASHPQAAQLTLFLDRDLYEGFIQTDNRGTRYVGTTRIQHVSKLNGIFTKDSDQINLRLATTPQTEELQHGELGYLAVLNSNGLQMNMKGSYSHTQPGHTLEPFEIESENKTGKLGFSYPFIRTRKFSLKGYSNFVYKNLSTDILNAPFTEDRLRIIRLGSNLEYKDFLMGENTFSIEASEGFDALDASSENDIIPTSRTKGKSDFIKYNLTLSRLQQIYNGFSFYISGTGQYTTDPLLASEEFSIGGTDFGRGYDFSEITGDRGLAGKTELRYTEIEQTKDKKKNSYQLYLFYDIGAVEDEDPSVGMKTRRSLSSAGGGYRLSLKNGIFLELEIAKPLTKKVDSRNEKGDDLRGFFNLSFQF